MTNERQGNVQQANGKPHGRYDDLPKQYGALLEAARARFRRKQHPIPRANPITTIPEIVTPVESPMTIARDFPDDLDGALSTLEVVRGWLEENVDEDADMDGIGVCVGVNPAEVRVDEGVKAAVDERAVNEDKLD